VGRNFGEGLGTTPQWDNGQIFGAGVDTQHIVDQEIAYAKGKIDGWIFDVYPPASMLDPGDETETSSIMLAFDAYMNSVLKPASGLKFCVLLQWTWYNYKSGKYINDWNAFLNTWLADPLYHKILGRRAIILYNDGGASGWGANLTVWNNLKAAVGGSGTVFGISVNSASMNTALGLEGNMIYGPNGGLIAGSGEGSYAQQVTQDTGTWGALPGDQKLSNITAVQDRRTFVPTTRYMDMGSRPALTTHITNGKNNAGCVFMPMYAHSELTEGGDPYDAGLYDCCSFARGGYKPQAYLYSLDFHSIASSSSNAILLTGAGWTYVNGVQGAYHNDELRNSTLNDKISITHNALRSFGIVGSTAVGRGTATVKADGVIIGTVSYNAAAAVRQTLFTHTFPEDPPVSHLVEIITDGTGVTSPDCIDINYKP
jgi:hypothetical protein